MHCRQTQSFSSDSGNWHNWQKVGDFCGILAGGFVILHVGVAVSAIATIQLRSRGEVSGSKCLVVWVGLSCCGLQDTGKVPLISWFAHGDLQWVGLVAGPWYVKANAMVISSVCGNNILGWQASSMGVVSST